MSSSIREGVPCMACKWSSRRSIDQPCRLLPSGNLPHGNLPHGRWNTSTTWPSDWSERLRGKDCPMCPQDRPDEDEYGIRIHAGRYSDAYLQRASWQLGYTSSCGVAATSPSQPSWPPRKPAGIGLKSSRWASALQRHYRPVKMNYQTLGNAVPHLHTHLLSRFAQDPARRAVHCRSRRGSGLDFPRRPSAGMRLPCGPWSERAVHAPPAGRRG